MTRQENSHERSLEFSSWIRAYLPASSTGFCVCNQDWIFWNWRTKKLILAEEKTHKAELPSGWQRRLIWSVLDPALSEYCPKNGITYLGYYVIRFENTSPDDGQVIIEKINSPHKPRRISIDELINLLSLL